MGDQSDTAGHHEPPKHGAAPRLPTERNFGLTFTIVPALLGLLSLWRQGSLWPWLFGIAALFLALTLFAPDALKPLNRAWFAFGTLLNKVMSPLILGFLFFLIFTPFALVFRLLGKRPLQLVPAPRGGSYWQMPSTANRMHNQF